MTIITFKVGLSKVVYYKKFYFLGFIFPEMTFIISCFTKENKCDVVIIS